MDFVKAALRTTLLGNAAIVGLVGDRIYTSHIASIDSVKFPCISLCTYSAETMENQLADNNTYQIDVWSKASNEELWAIYNEVKLSVNLKPINGLKVFLCRQIYVNDDLYEKDTKTFHLAARYKIISR